MVRYQRGRSDADLLRAGADLQRTITLGKLSSLAVARSLAAGTTGRAAARLGEATLRVEILLGGSEHEFLSTVRAGQILVVVHENENSSR